MHASTTLVRPQGSSAPVHRSAPLPAGHHHGGVLDPRGRHGPLPRPPVQPGIFDDLLGAAGPGLLGAASSLLSGDSGGALEQVRETGGSALSGLAQQGVGALGSAIGGSVGGAVSSLGGAVGQGVGDVVSGQSSVGEAVGGLGSAAQPALLSLLMSLLNR